MLKILKRYYRHSLVIKFFFFTFLYHLIINFLSGLLFKEPKGSVHQVVVICATRQLIYDANNLTDITQVEHLEALVLSLLEHTLEEQIHFNIITYEKEVGLLSETMEFLLRKSKTVSYEFVSLDVIQKKFKRDIQLSQKYTAKENHKYYDITVHIRHLYPKIFTYSKVVVLDIDLEFSCPFKELYKQFGKMNALHIGAMAYDQSPHYRRAFKSFRIQNGGTKIGDPSPSFQGFNTGVMLFDLDKARQSKDFNYRLTEAGYVSLFEKYKLQSMLGDQDFFTLLGAEYSYLFYVLDCSFNRQLDTFFSSDPMFNTYHKCENKVKIYHANGQSIIPSKNKNSNYYQTFIKNEI